MSGLVTTVVLNLEVTASLAQDPKKVKLSLFVYGKWDVLWRRCRNKVHDVLVKVRGNTLILLAGIECSEDLLQADV